MAKTKKTNDIKASILTLEQLCEHPFSRPYTVKNIFENANEGAFGLYYRLYPLGGKFKPNCCTAINEHLTL
jgi:hypothetical protein